MAETLTTNYGWTKPDVGGSTDNWGGEINTDLDGIDSVVHGIQTSVPLPSASLPAMDGTATIGVSALFARADHIHPTDTTRYAASNPSGFQTAAQVAAVVPAASSTTPAMDGTAAIGVGATFARADHVHPSDTTRYAAANPSGFQTAAQVTASLVPYALASSVAAPSTTTPVMDGAGSVGAGTTFARADHQHPSDTTRYAATNPAGYQTAAQVTAAVPVSSGATPIMDGTATGGVAATWSRSDHVHPSDTSLLALAGGTVTGALTVSNVVNLSRSTFPLGSTITATGATSIPWTSGEVRKVNLTGNATFTITAWPATGNLAKIVFDITNGGAFNITWPAATKWAGGAPPVITSGSGSRDVIMLMTDDGGTTILGSVIGQAFA